MPFTASHIAAVLPFVGTRFGRAPLAASGLVVGSMAPDLLYFVPVHDDRDFTHTLLGLVTVDLAVGLVVVALWQLVLRGPVIDLAPAWLRQRMPRRRPVMPRASAGPAAALREAVVPSRRAALPLAVLVLVLALVAGGLTHLLWDSFTHSGWVTDHIAPLRATLGPLVVYKWLQYASGVVGLAVVAVWALRWVRRAPVSSSSSAEAIASGRARVIAWVAVAGTFVVAGLATWFVGISAGRSAFDPGLVFLVARISIGLAVAVAVLVCAWWQVARLLELRRRVRR